MRILRILVLALIPLGLAAIPAPAGNDAQGCGLPAIQDPGIRASFERFERTQSTGAATLCALYMNSEFSRSAAR